MRVQSTPPIAKDLQKQSTGNSHAAALDAAALSSYHPIGSWSPPLHRRRAPPVRAAPVQAAPPVQTAPEPRALRSPSLPSSSRASPLPAPVHAAPAGPVVVVPPPARAGRRHLPARGRPAGGGPGRAAGDGQGRRRRRRADRRPQRRPGLRRCRADGRPPVALLTGPRRRRRDRGPDPDPLRVPAAARRTCPRGQPITTCPFGQRSQTRLAGPRPNPTCPFGHPLHTCPFGQPCPGRGRRARGRGPRPPTAAAARRQRLRPRPRRPERRPQAEQPATCSCGRPGVYVSRPEGDAVAHEIYLRGFNAAHGQDIEFTVGGVPINQLSHLHGQGYADLNFILPEVVRSIRVTEGVYDPHQGDFAVAGSIDFDLGVEQPRLSTALHRRLLRHLPPARPVGPARPVRRHLRRRRRAPQQRLRP
jgi:hypothetical protein